MRFKKIIILVSVIFHISFSSWAVEENTTSEKNNVDINTHQIDTENIPHEYKQELEDFKRLQMNNVKLKLQAENDKLSKQVGINGAEVKLIYIYSTANKGRVAEVLGGGGGLREISVGDYLTGGYLVKEIGADYILSISNDGKEKLLKLLSPGQG
ncbi:hypothetical protein AAEU23_004711 [Escherichia coli]|nr:hypothetical protein [Escherichia coli]